MNFCSRVSFVTAIVLLFAAAIGLPKAEAITYDLNADWSDSSNPNGVWSYDEGTNLLPHQTNWDPGDFTLAQPAWARSSLMTDHTFLPAWLKLSSTPLFALDLQIGDVALHTTDVTNGVGSGPGNVTWTSPITGTVDLSGSVWEARDIGRSNRWSLDINGTVVSQGDISAANSSRSSPFDLASGTGGTAALDNISVAVGEVIKLQFDETSSDTFGDFVGVNFTVNGATLPTVSMTVTDGSASEVPSTDTGKVRIARTGATTSPLTVFYSVGGTAKNGRDYKKLRGQAIIKSGASSVNIVIQAIDDTIPEPDETVILTLSPDANYTVGSPNSGTVTIHSNE